MNTTLILKKDSSYFGFEWNRPIRDHQIRFNKYEGLSLEEISKKYGNICAQHVYTMAARHGVDLTNPKLNMDELRYETIINIKFEHKDFNQRKCWELSVVSDKNSVHDVSKVIRRGFVYKDFVGWDLLLDAKIKECFGDIIA
ncbi:MAG: hypothetical protein KUG64_10725 [Cycloclasticus sp.]|nr:hypothetical protein [Cycloclasticus sp.]